MQFRRLFGLLALAAANSQQAKAKNQLLCPNGANLPAAHLQIQFFFDYSAFKDVSFHERFVTGIYGLLESPPEVDGLVVDANAYVYTNRPPRNDWDPRHSSCGMSVSSKWTSFDFLAGSAQIWNERVDRPMSDETRKFTSLQDPMYWSLKHDEWILDDVDENGLPVVRFIFISTDEAAWSDWTAPSTGYGDRPHADSVEYLTNPQPSDWCKEANYPRECETNNMRVSHLNNTFFSLFVYDEPRSQVRSVSDWYRDVYFPKLMGNPKHWIDKLDLGMDEYTIYNMINKRIAQAVCSLIMDPSPTPPGPPTTTTTTVTTPKPDSLPPALLVCDDNLENSVQFKFGYFNDRSAFWDHDLRMNVFNAVGSVWQSIGAFGMWTEAVAYDFMNRPPVGTYPDDTWCSRRLTANKDYKEAYDDYMETILYDPLVPGSVIRSPRPITDDDPLREYSSLQDSIFHSLKNDPWAWESEFLHGYRVERFILITTDVAAWSDWTEPSTDYGHMSPIHEAGLWEVDASGYCQQYAYPTIADTAGILAGKEHIHVQVIVLDQKQAYVPSVKKWYEETYLPVVMGGVRGWVDVVTEQTSQWDIEQMIRGRMHAAVCGEISTTTTTTTSTTTTTTSTTTTTTSTTTTPTTTPTTTTTTTPTTTTTTPTTTPTTTTTTTPTTTTTTPTTTPTTTTTTTPTTTTTTPTTTPTTTTTTTPTTTTTTPTTTTTTPTTTTTTPTTTTTTSTTTTTTPTTTTAELITMHPATEVSCYKLLEDLVTLLGVS